jgi:hypothetical protein
MPWADVAKVMRTAAEAMLPLHALEMSSVRVKVSEQGGGRGLPYLRLGSFSDIR